MGLSIWATYKAVIIPEPRFEIVEYELKEKKEKEKLQRPPLYLKYTMTLRETKISNCNQNSTMVMIKRKISHRELI